MRKPMHERDILHLDDVRLARAKAIQTVQHAVVALTMAASGYTALSRGDGSHRWIAILEIAAAAALFVSIAIARRHYVRGSHARFGWIEIASGTLLIVEGLTKQHHAGRWLRASYVSGFVVIMIGVFEARLSSHRRGRRSLEATEDRLRVRLGPFQGFHLPWTEIQRATRDEKRYTFENQDGKKKSIRLNRLRNKEAAIAWLDSHLTEKEIPIETAS
ncbi:MAG: hypothetical protein ABI592_00625 [Acidobacteriota bacterium]